MVLPFPIDCPALACSYLQTWLSVQICMVIPFFLRTAIMSYNKLDGLVEHKFTLMYFWNPKVQYQFHRAKIQVSLKLYLGGCPGEPVLASSSRCYFGGTSILAASASPSLLCFSSLFWLTFIRTCDWI